MFLGVIGRRCRRRRFRWGLPPVTNGQENVDCSPRISLIRNSSTIQPVNSPSCGWCLKWMFRKFLLFLCFALYFGWRLGHFVTCQFLKCCHLFPADCVAGSVAIQLRVLVWNTLPLDSTVMVSYGRSQVWPALLQNAFAAHLIILCFFLRCAPSTEQWRKLNTF